MFLKGLGVLLNMVRRKERHSSSLSILGEWKVQVERKHGAWSSPQAEGPLGWSVVRAGPRAFPSSSPTRLFIFTM